MTWYYVQNGEQAGPVEQTTLESLARQGTVGADTLVWQQGMANWQPYASVTTLAQHPAPVAAAIPPSAGLAFATCGRCGQSFPTDEVVQLGGRWVCAGCKPIVLQGMQEGVSLVSHEEQVRRAHLRHETNIKSIGLLYFVSGGSLALGGLAAASISITTPNMAENLLAGILFLAIAGVLIVTGVGLRKLRPWSRTVSAIIAAIGLLGFPMGTLINGFILYLLLSKKGSMIFSEPYQQVLAATPHIKPRTSIIIWILLGILLLLLAFALIGIALA